MTTGQAELQRRVDNQRFDCTDPSSDKLCNVTGRPIGEWCDGCVVSAALDEVATLRARVQQLEQALPSVVEWIEAWRDDDEAGGDKALELLCNIEDELRAALVEATPSCRVPLEERLRHAWETGFRLAVAYGDNYAHWDGEQRERQWQDFLSAHPMADPAPAPMPTPPLISQEVLDGLTVAGARAFWALKDLEKQYESLRVDVMTVVSDPHLTWEQARQALRDALK